MGMEGIPRVASIRTEPIRNGRDSLDCSRREGLGSVWGDTVKLEGRSGLSRECGEAGGKV